MCALLAVNINPYSGMQSLVHGHVREMVGLLINGPRRRYAPDKWPSYDPDIMPNGYHQDPGTNVTT